MVNQKSMSKKTSIYVFVSDRLHSSLQITFIQGSPVYGQVLKKNHTLQIYRAFLFINITISLHVLKYESVYYDLNLIPLTNKNEILPSTATELYLQK